MSEHALPGWSPARPVSPAEQRLVGRILDRINDHMNPRLDELLPWNWAPKAAPQEQAA